MHCPVRGGMKPEQETDEGALAAPVLSGEAEDRAGFPGHGHARERGAAVARIREGHGAPGERRRQVRGVGPVCHRSCRPIDGCRECRRAHQGSYEVEGPLREPRKRRSHAREHGCLREGAALPATVAQEEQPHDQRGPDDGSAAGEERDEPRSRGLGAPCGQLLLDGALEGRSHPVADELKPTTNGGRQGIQCRHHRPPLTLEARGRNTTYGDRAGGPDGDCQPACENEPERLDARDESSHNQTRDSVPDNLR